MERNNYLMLSVVFLFRFFQTHFANSEFIPPSNENIFMSQICDKHSAFRNFEALYLRAFSLERSSFFEKLYGKVVIDHVPNW